MTVRYRLIVRYLLTAPWCRLRGSRKVAVVDEPDDALSGQRSTELM